MKPDQVQSRPRHQRGQPLHELQRAHDQVRRSVAPRRLELELHLPCRVELHPLVRERRSRDVAAQLFQSLAVERLETHCGVQAEAVDVGTQGLARCGLARHALQAALALCMREPFARHGTVSRDGPMPTLSPS